MGNSIRYIAEYYNEESGKVIESSILRTSQNKAPASIDELGYSHEEA